MDLHLTFAQALQIAALLVYAGSNLQMLRDHDRRIKDLEKVKVESERVAAEHDLIIKQGGYAHCRQEDVK